MNINYFKLNNSINLKEFNCGDSEDHQKLNKFLKERAINHQKDMIGTTLIACDLDSNKKIIGYMTLLTDGITVEEKQKKNFFESIFMRNKYSTYPALKIGRLAIDKNYQKKGIGRYLFQLAIATGIKINEQAGTRFIIVDSKKMSTGFYKKLEFKELNEKDPYFLYYDLKGWKK